MRITGQVAGRRRALPFAVLVVVVAAAWSAGVVPDAASGQAQGLSPNAAYVQTVYQNLLGRAVDPAGSSYWTGVLDSGVPRQTVSWALVNSDEYRSDVIAGMYAKFLNRGPDAGGLSYWVGQVAGGMTFEWFQSFLIGSDEYYGSGAKGKGDNTDFVKSMYSDVLGRPVDSGGLNYFVSLLAAGTSRAQVVAAIVYSTEHLDSTVDGYYVKFLSRHVDPSGEAYWVGQLQAGARDESIVALIAGSDEYFADATSSPPPPTTTTTTTTSTTTTTTSTTTTTTTTTISSDPRATTGQWGAPVNYGAAAGVMQHSVLIPGTSKVLFFEDGAGTYVLDPNAGTFANQTAANNLFCAGQTVLADGRIMTLGGDQNGQPADGLTNTDVYNPATNTWTPTAAMHYLRWYPTATKLADGRILATSGTASGVVQTIPEVYDPGANSWTALPSANNYIPIVSVHVRVARRTDRADGNVHEPDRRADPEPGQLDVVDGRPECHRCRAPR